MTGLELGWSSNLNAIVNCPLIYYQQSVQGCSSVNNVEQYMSLLNIFAIICVNNSAFIRPSIKHFQVPLILIDYFPLKLLPPGLNISLANP